MRAGEYICTSTLSLGLHHPRRRDLPLMSVNGRWPGWMDERMPVVALRLDTLASLESGQYTTRRLGCRGKG
jgi:hypothetical protein